MPQIIAAIIIIAILYSLTVAVIEFVVTYLAPVIGAALLAILAAILLNLSYRYFKDPANRLTKKFCRKIEEKRQKHLYAKELQRKIKSERELFHIKAKIATNRLKEQTQEIIRDDEYDLQLEKLVDEFLLTLSRQKIKNIRLLHERHEDIKTLISQSKYVDSKEKIEIYESANHKKTRESIIEGELLKS